jgi:hypothetical protein
VANLRDPSASKLAEKSSNPAENLKENISMIPENEIDETKKKIH